MLTQPLMGKHMVMYVARIRDDEEVLAEQHSPDLLHLEAWVMRQIDFRYQHCIGELIHVGNGNVIKRFRSLF